jgi:restriction system protein
MARTDNKVPTFDHFMNPILKALSLLGGSATIAELDSKVIELMRLTREQLDILHNPERDSRTEVEYRTAWARTYLKKYGIIENSSRGVWALTHVGQEISEVDPREVKAFVREKSATTSTEETLEIEAEVTPSWRDEAMTYLLHMDPSAFERLTQRLLRESGFTQVEVTGRSGDGGIDGKGIMRLGGLLSFHVIFQCKRYQGSVSSPQVRDFRGAMVGRADKGLLITTGNFTKDAIKEATRDGAPPIDLVDGDQLIDKLKELGLGIQVKKIEVEQIFADKEWFEKI